MNGASSTTQQPNRLGQPPFWAEAPVKTSRRGHFWIPGERFQREGKTYQRGPMFVQWEAPEQVTQPYPLVLVHGGTLQGTEWLDTPDGRPGWAQRFLEVGYAVFLPDRPGHGRSPYHPDLIGAPGPAFSYERAREVYFAPAAADRQTQWLFGPDDAAAFDAFIAPYGPMPADLALSQDLDADRLARLLDRIGPAVVLTHSASGPDGWLLADRRPGLVKAIVSIEPMGPPFSATPGIGTLDWGLTAAPAVYDPPRATAAEVRAAEPSARRVPAWSELPVAVVTGEVSSFAEAGPAIVDFLVAAGAAAEPLHLPDHGIFGNGHGLIYEKNSDQILDLVLRWLADHIDPAGFRKIRSTAELRAATQSISMPDRSTPKQILQRFYEAERRYMQADGASFEEFAATLAPDVVLHQSPDLPWGGEYVGPQRYEEWARAMNAVFDQVDMQEVEFFEQDDKVVVVGRLVTRIRATGETMDEPMTQVITVKDGKITDFRPFYWNVPAYVAAATQSLGR